MTITSGIKSLGNDIKSFGKETLNHFKSKKTEKNEAYVEVEKAGKASPWYAIAGVISLVAMVLFALTTAASAASTIGAGVSGVGAPGIVPGIFATAVFAGCTVSSAALAAYFFSYV